MFNIQVEQTALSKALSFIAPTVGKDSNLGTDCIAVTDDGNFGLELYTTNGIEFSRTKIVLTLGSGTVERMPFVNFKRFQSIIDSIDKGEYVSIKATVNTIEINYGTRKKPIKLTASPVGMMLFPVVTSPVEFSIDTGILEKILANANAIIKEDPNNLINNCILISLNGHSIEATAVDGKNNRAYSCYSSNTDLNTGNLLLEVPKVKRSFRLFSNYNTVTIKSNGNITSILGTNSAGDETEYCTRQISGTFPNSISQLFNVNIEYSQISIKELEKSLTRINAIEDSTVGSDTLDLTIDGQLVNIFKASQYGIIEDSFDAENKISYKIHETFKAKPLLQVINAVLSNCYYGASEYTFAHATIEIGKCVHAGKDYYLIRKSSSANDVFLMSGYTNTNTP